MSSLIITYAPPRQQQTTKSLACQRCQHSSMLTRRRALCAPPTPHPSNCRRGRGMHTSRDLTWAGGRCRCYCRCCCRCTINLWLRPGPVGVPRAPPAGPHSGAAHKKLHRQHWQEPCLLLLLPPAAAAPRPPQPRPGNAPPTAARPLLLPPLPLSVVPVLEQLRVVRVRHADFVVARGGDVAHPRQRLVAALLNHLEVAYLQQAVGRGRAKAQGPSGVISTMIDTGT